MKIDKGSGGLTPSTTPQGHVTVILGRSPTPQATTRPTGDHYRAGPPIAPPWQLRVMEQMGVPVQAKTVQGLTRFLGLWHWQGIPSQVRDRQVFSLGLFMLRDGVVLSPAHLAALARDRDRKNTQGPGPGAEIRTIPDLLRHVMDDGPAREARHKEVLPHVYFPLFLLNLPSQFSVALPNDDEAWGFEPHGASFSVWRLRVNLPHLGPLQLTLLRRGKLVGMDVGHGKELGARQRNMILHLLRETCRKHLSITPSVDFRPADFTQPLALEGNEWVLEALTGVRP